MGPVGEPAKGPECLCRPSVPSIRHFMGRACHIQAQFERNVTWVSHDALIRCGVVERGGGVAKRRCHLSLIASRRKSRLAQIFIAGLGRRYR